MRSGTYVSGTVTGRDVVQAIQAVGAQHSVAIELRTGTVTYEGEYQILRVHAEAWVHFGAGHECAGSVKGAWRVGSPQDLQTCLYMLVLELDSVLRDGYHLHTLSAGI